MSVLKWLVALILVAAALPAVKDEPISREMYQVYLCGSFSAPK